MRKKELELDFEMEIRDAYKFQEMFAKNVCNGKVMDEL